jgi:predicted Rossmann fold nucleotide-binding protein DprA/Smf involved in DNA uptake
MTTLPISADGQAIALVCTSLALGGERTPKPLTPTEWNDLSRAMHPAGLRPSDLLGLDSEQLRDALGIAASHADRLAALLSRGGQLALEIERLSSRGIWIITRADDAYPEALRNRLGRTAPPLLFGAGPRAGLQLKAIAIVGSRDVDEEGLTFAAELGGQCAAQGFAVVSGAARGVDLTAMASAVSRGGSAVGVTVDPLERLVSRRDLRAPITDELLTLVTPFHPSARWHAGNAMRRNRLIYALARAAVVVASSAEKGGTRSGALENLKANWAPLHVRDDGSAGNRLLISEGATPLPAGISPEELEIERLATNSAKSLLDPDAPSAAPKVGPPADLFVEAWPIIALQLRVPRSERDIAELLDLQLTQARAWLARAADEGLVSVKKRPKRYVLRDVSDQQLSIDSAA